MVASYPLVISACLVLTTAIGAVDYVTGAELRVFPLYFFPISLAAWKLGRRMAILFSALATVAWAVSNQLAMTREVAAWIWGVNGVMQFAVFAFSGFLLAEVRRSLLAERATSRSDPLTTLPNTRGFFDRAEAVLALAQRSRQQLTLAFIDLDHFKQVNDTHGHRAGDQALQLAASTLRRNLRDCDIVARIGGDEFVALLPQASAADARICLERIRGAIARSMRERAWPVTASIGAIAFATAPTTIQDAMHAADGLMYEVKRDGRDRVRVEPAAS